MFEDLKMQVINHMIDLGMVFPERLPENSSNWLLSKKNNLLASRTSLLKDISGFPKELEQISAFAKANKKKLEQKKTFLDFLEVLPISQELRHLLIKYYSIESLLLLTRTKLLQDIS